MIYRYYVQKPLTQMDSTNKTTQKNCRETLNSNGLNKQNHPKTLQRNPQLKWTQQIKPPKNTAEKPSTQMDSTN